MEEGLVSGRWLVFGGWGFETDVLTPIFGPDSVYIDVNRLMPGLIVDGSLRPDWRDCVWAAIQPSIAEVNLPVAGWSCGSIVAFALLDRLRPPRATFLAATPSFCAREGFAHGTDPRAVRAMRRQLLRDRDATLRDFRVRCGVSNDASVRSDHSTDVLAAGLDFLEQASLLPVSRSSIPLTFIHGRDDAVVPFEAGRLFAERSGGSFEVRHGGHFPGSDQDYLHIQQ